MMHLLIIDASRDEFLTCKNNRTDNTLYMVDNKIIN